MHQPLLPYASVIPFFDPLSWLHKELMDLDALVGGRVSVPKEQVGVASNKWIFVEDNDTLKQW